MTAFVASNNGRQKVWMKSIWHVASAIGSSGALIEMGSASCRSRRACSVHSISKDHDQCSHTGGGRLCPYDEERYEG